MRHDFRALEASLTLSDLKLEGLLFAYDLHHFKITPLLRIVTFFGDPVRHDLSADLGWGLRLLRVESAVKSLAQASGRITDFEFAQVHLGWNIWQDLELYNFVRLEFGGLVGGLFDEHQQNSTNALFYAGGDIHLKVRVGLDTDGFHYLVGGLYGFFQQFFESKADTFRVKAGASVGYEWIMLSINDQPFSLSTRLTAAFRKELSSELDAWELGLATGFRFSFWAPVRIHQEIELPEF